MYVIELEIEDFDEYWDIETYGELIIQINKMINGKIFSDFNKATEVLKYIKNYLLRWYDVPYCKYDKDILYIMDDCSLIMTLKVSKASICDYDYVPEVENRSCYVVDDTGEKYIYIDIQDSFKININGEKYNILSVLYSEGHLLCNTLIDKDIKIKESESFNEDGIPFVINREDIIEEDRYLYDEIMKLVADTLI